MPTPEEIKAMVEKTALPEDYVKLSIPREIEHRHRAN